MVCKTSHKQTELQTNEYTLLYSICDWHTEVSLAGAIGGRSGERRRPRAGLALRPAPDEDAKPVAEAGRSSNALVAVAPAPERRAVTRSRSCPRPPASRSVLSEKSSMSAFRLAIVSFSRFERARICVRSASVNPCGGSSSVKYTAALVYLFIYYYSFIIVIHLLVRRVIWPISIPGFSQSVDCSMLGPVTMTILAH